MSSTPDNISTRRLFVALWPDTAVRRSLEELLERLPLKGGKAVPLENLHITLNFLGPVAPDRRECIERVLAAVQGESFTLAFDTLGYFPRPRVLWLGAAQVPEALRHLSTALNQGLQDCGFTPDSRLLVPLMTLRRKVNHSTPLHTVDPLIWVVRDFVLVESVTLPAGAQYTVLGRWPLAESDGS